MNVPVQKLTPAEAAYVDDYTPGDDRLSALRQRGFDAFARCGLPHRRLEEWRWTDLRRLIGDEFPASAGAPVGDIDALIDASPLKDLARARLIFVNGVFDAERSSLPASGDVTVAALASAEEADRLSFREDDPVDALNLANVSDGAVISIAGHADATAPIEIVNVCAGAGAATYSTRNLITLGAGASATLFETHLGAGDPYVTTTVSEVRLGAGARLDRVKLQMDDGEAIHLSNLIATLADNARLADFTLTTGGKVTRQQGFVTFTGEHAKAGLSGAFLLAGRQHADTRLVIDHAVARCTSRELFKCVMDERARGVFQGKVIVRPHAQKTDGKQSSHGLLLAEGAEFDAKPELEIYADDVVCGHGATSGELSDEHLFYLRSRGIPHDHARAMLIAAFVAEAFDEVADENVRTRLGELAEGWLAGRAGEKA